MLAPNNDYKQIYYGLYQTRELSGLQDLQEW